MTNREAALADGFVLMVPAIRRGAGEPLPGLPFQIDMKKVEARKQEMAEFWSKIFSERSEEA